MPNPAQPNSVQPKSVQPNPSQRNRLQEPQILEIMHACGPRRDGLVIGLLGLQGLRPRQVSALRAGDLDLPGETLRVLRQGTADGWDEVDLHPDLARALKAYLRHDRNAPRQPGDPLLPRRPGEQAPITPEQVNHVVRKVSRETRELAGTEFTVADLRWSCAKNLHERGVPLETLAEFLGAPSPANVQRFLERGFE